MLNFIITKNFLFRSVISEIYIDLQSIDNLAISAFP